MAYKQKGFTAFTKKDDNKKKRKEYEPQTVYRGYKGSEYTDLTPQTERQKMDSDYLKGHIEGKFDNEYREALDSGDKTRIAREESQMLKYKKELDNRGVKYDYVDMTDFGKKKKKKSPMKKTIDPPRKATVKVKKLAGGGPKRNKKEHVLPKITKATATVNKKK